MSYLVRIEAAGREKDTCTCSVHCDSGSLCKHIFLAERFRKAKLSPRADISEISHNGDSTSMDSNSFQVKEAAASAHDTSNSESIPSSEDSLVSHSDRTSQGPGDVSHQSPDFRAAQSTMATDVDTDDDVVEIGSNMTFDRQFEEYFQAFADEVMWNISIVKLGPSWSLELVHNTKETEKKR